VGIVNSIAVKDVTLSSNLLKRYTITTVNILLFFQYPKNGAESLLESQMNIKYDFLKILSLIARR
jgi:hypothetical protein